ncbi:MAG: glucuronate isomerase [Lachnospiraceae bacterium]|nr:glucuronate isomerase [Lachnospiraceae bacterium]MBR5732824.1 glucuronate isomerase [Lachnospiraceae bacterium]
MAKAFMDKDFILNSETAKILYHNYAAKMPIMDYHCHLSPREIWEDRRFKNITEVWLGGDHYKWRLMRANGVDEKYVTGDAPDKEKFFKFAETLEKCIGNPVFQWSHLELRVYFGYEGVLNSKTAEEVWNLCNAKLAEPAFSARGLMKMSNVKLVCTTDDPIDSLEYHEKIKADTGFDITVLPAWRPDKVVNIEKPDFAAYVKKLGEAAGVEIACLNCVKKALKNRLDFFAAHGCKLSDHGIEYAPCVPTSFEEANAVFKKAFAGEAVTAEEIAKYKTYILGFFGEEYAERGWTMQLHYGCKRNNNARMFAKLGPDTGYDCILNGAPGPQLADFLDMLDKKDKLPKTIIYSLDPNDNAVIETIMGCFQDSAAVGKMQHGSAWWFNDHKDGMEAQMKSLANEGVLGNFIGMLTDSRSFLSYPRHEYFRRIMCNLIAGFVENGEYPWDEELLGKMVQDISYNNAERYFDF